jgi:Ser/Thr protein kinase RdoA (MazF antagonist)
MTPLTTLIETHWNLARVVADATLQQNPTRSVVAIRSDQGRHVVKVYRDEWALGLVNPTVAEIDRRLTIFDYLERTGFRQAPALVKTRTGDRFVRGDGATIYILGWVAGTRPPATPGTWAALGRLAADLNTRTDYPHDFAIPVAGAMAELAEQADGYSFRSEFLALVATLDVLADGPTCLIHGELNPANAIRSPDGRLIVLDWDQAGTGPWALEGGYPLITTFLSEDLSFDARSAAAFFGAWTGGHDLDAERRELIFTAALFHALRYLPFGDPARRWARIRHALAHRRALLSVLNGDPGSA